MAVATVCVLGRSRLSWPAETEGPNPQKRAAAREKLVDGDRFLKQGEFQKALAAFKSAYDLYPSPKIHYNFGLAYEGMGRNADALDEFEAFLQGAPDAQPEVRDRARATREALLARVGTLRVIADVSGANVVVDGREIGKTPLPHDIRVDPGSHLVLADPGGGVVPFMQRTDVAAGALFSVVVRFAIDSGLATAKTPTGGETVTTEPTISVKAPEPGTSTNLHPDRAWAIAGVATVGGGVALIVTGLVFGLAARAAAADVSKKYDADRDSAGRRDQRLQWVGYGFGAAAIATGTWLFLHGNATGQIEPDQAGESRAFNVLVSPSRLILEAIF